MSFANVPITKEFDFNGQKLTLQTGLLANQATSSVLATLGETVVLATVVVGGETGNDYFPLQIVYEERLYASGKIKDSQYMKREGRPSDQAILVGRLIDRSLRSLFNHNIRHNIQIVVTVLSLDKVNSPDTLGVLAASSALNMLDFELDKSNLETESEMSVGTSAPNAEKRDGSAIVIFNPKLQKYGVIQAPNQEYYQLAAGGTDGEDYLIAARREVAEETGITQIESEHYLGQPINLNFYHDLKQVQRVSQTQTFLFVTNQEIPDKQELEPGETFEFSWQDAKRIMECSEQNQNGDFKDIFKEQFTRGVSKAIQLGLDVISDPNQFNKQFLDKSLEEVKLFKGPVASVRVGIIDNNLVINPSYEARKESKLDLVVSGDGQSIMMLEAGADIIPEETLGQALDFAMSHLKDLIKMQVEFVKANKV